MKALLVNPSSPESYWSGVRSLRFAGRRCLLPPLGLLTVASLLPPRWRLDLADENVAEIRDERLRAADVAMLTGMLVQRDSLQKLLARCRALGVRTVVGGPYATTFPEDLAAADHVAVGEGEEFVPRLAADLEAGTAARVYRAEGWPDLAGLPPPRFDLLPKRVYRQMAIQFSRGCPFDCE
ncbi:MAG TPA: cobalamin-dependent protein, partial [Acidobacteriota bacterium]|nr:cobalamin-dependent protein [Acidobacteriota bacterium]